ncbi:hypothetical protein HA466_0230700 [Hirschfeldia incana]|nr:hypothetical protein HA466_0230700 [Hirschfeldia incana]KAJ0239428.1 hypothetical protein HA466_0230700 [Hirschfeldia incana]
MCLYQQEVSGYIQTQKQTCWRCILKEIKFVYGGCDEKSAWPYRKERENSEEVYFGLLEFKCKNKVHKQSGLMGVQSLLRQVNCFEAGKGSLGSLSLTNHR